MADDVIILDEITAFGLIRRVRRGETPRILMTDPLLPPLKRVLDRIEAWALARGARRLIDDYPEHAQEWAYPTLIFADDVLATIEPWQARHFDFDAASADRRHGFALKLLATMFMFRRYMAAFLLNKHVAATGARVVGASPELVGLARAWFGPDALSGIATRAVPNRLLNLAALALGLGAALALVAAKLRPSVTTRSVFVMADHNDDWRDVALYQAFRRNGEVMVVMRNAEVAERAAERFGDWPRCLPGDGAFNPWQALEAAAVAVRDCGGLWLRRGGLAPGLYWEMALLPFRRLRIRALFNRCQPDIFWARDDYNVEHVLRRQELRRVGAAQWGLNHAVQGITILMPQLRWVSMDHYFTIGSAFHRHFKGSWDVAGLHAIGSFAFTEADFRRPTRTSSDILFMARFAIGNPEFVRAVRLAAERFPDRTILLQVKSGYPHDTLTPGFIENCRQGLANVVHVTDPVYDLVARADMIVSDPSTIIAEAIQLGTPTLMIDVIPGQKTSIFREFPGLCADSAEAVAERLGAWADGRETFERERFAALVNLDRRPYPEIVGEILAAETAVHNLNAVDPAPSNRL
ncbi:hypothetical protein [Magnetospirillum sp. SS-4]|uniref:hypothetical protein n=1 Tax=Magnetospirillum sp. SS-4 TaxID=2681465 RepID=UPI001384FF27|nr:hypothetical protein [Magnetospirillum sp. SS-4]CAA7614524.1 hypothetical protein MTBSS4_110158 [Magnetospirillum sp. SS-4]